VTCQHSLAMAQSSWARIIRTRTADSGVAMSASGCAARWRHNRDPRAMGVESPKNGIENLVGYACGFNTGKVMRVRPELRVLVGADALS